MNQAFDLVMRAFAKGRTHHAYIFSGPEGVGRKTAAMAFAAALIEYEKISETDLRSSAYRHSAGYKDVLGRIERRAHPDFTWIEPEERVLKVDDVRGLARELAYPPLQGKRRVVVIHQAERMQAAAANAILKTLEEPPSYVVFLLLALEENLLLPTLRSRSQLVRFAPLRDSEVESIVRKTAEPGTTGEDIAAAVRWGGGSVTRARRFLEDPDYRRLVESANEALLKLWETNPAPSLETLAFVDSLKSPDEMRVTLMVWLRLARDLAGACAGEKNRYQDAGEARFYRIADKLRARPGKSAADFAPILDRAASELDANVNAKLVLTALCGDLRL